jgi:N-acetylneuraminate epimerase
MNPPLFTGILFASCALCLADDTNALRWTSLARLPDSNGVAAPFAGVSGGALLVAGGANFPGRKPWEGGTKVWHDNVFILGEPNSKWELAGHLPRPLAYGVSVSHNNEVICAGGSDASRHYTEVFALTWRDGKLTHRMLPPLPRPLANACGALLDGTFYICGGIETRDATNALHTFFALDLKSSTWQQLQPWPGAPRMLAMAAAQDRSLFLIGGVELVRSTDGKTARRYLRDGYKYSAESGWRRIADLPMPLAAAPSPAAIIGTNLFLVISGDDGINAGITPLSAHPGFTNQVLVYDTKHDAWRRIGVTPAPRVTAPAVKWRDSWIIPSGEQRPGVRSPEVWSLRVTAR